MSTSAPMAGTPDPVPQANLDPPMSEVGRITNIFAAPSKAFTDIERRPSWWVPFVILAIFSYVLVFAVDSKVGWDTVTMNQMKQSPKQMERLDQLKASDPARYDQQLKLSIAITKGISFAYPLLGLIINLVIAAIFMATLNFGLAAEVKFGQVLAVLYYSGLVGIVKVLLAAITLFAGSNPENFNFSNPVGTNPAYYMDPTAVPKPLYAVASFFDVVTIWALVLMSIGLAIAAKKKTSSAAAVVFGWFAVIALFSAVGAMFR